MKNAWTVAAVLSAVVAVAACSGSASNGAATGNGTGQGGASGPYGSCLTSLLGSSCLSCLQNSCGGALGGLESGCGDYLDCICPGGDFSAPNAQSATCGSKLTESSCVATQGDGGAFACGACASACSTGVPGSSGATFGTSSSSGGSSQTGSSSGSGFGSSSGSSGSCPSSALPATKALFLSLTGVNFGDATSSGWMNIGYDLDGLCTTESSIDTCLLAAGASKQAQDDGSSGIDNGYGHNLCAIFDAIAGPGACSTKIAQAFLQTDATGSGVLVVGNLAYPVRDVHVSMNGAGGMAGGVLPTSGVATAWMNEAPCISSSLCSGSALQSILTQLEQASDIMADGTNGAGVSCDGISFGLTFTGSAPATSLPSPASCPCGG